MTTSGLNNLSVVGAGVLGGKIAWRSAFKGRTWVRQIMILNKDAGRIYF